MLRSPPLQPPLIRKLPHHRIIEKQDLNFVPSNISFDPFGRVPELENAKWFSHCFRIRETRHLVMLISRTKTEQNTIFTCTGVSVVASVISNRLSGSCSHVASTICSGHCKDSAINQKNRHATPPFVHYESQKRCSEWKDSSSFFPLRFFAELPSRQ